MGEGETPPVAANRLRLVAGWPTLSTACFYFGGDNTSDSPAPFCCQLGQGGGVPAPASSSAQEKAQGPTAWVLASPQSPSCRDQPVLAWACGLGFTDKAENEKISKQAQDDYCKLFDNPLSDSHLAALAAIFGWKVGETDQAGSVGALVEVC
ncbi:hypothetical protein E2562_038348 [Oryza meyeriana var. granulata]|uniref:Uncharacterized protein n=1 Tax=Oryza meyeriana var. granulata TaxID=110450 RepID=A0A6G1FGQ0_9ORYZ|nr:hypothetical protein E2562_038348 [Oryza meyeriana var. granulata]